MGARWLAGGLSAEPDWGSGVRETPPAQGTKAQYPSAEESQRARLRNGEGREQPFRLGSETGGEIKDVGAAATAAVPEGQRPKALPSRVAVERAEERAGYRVVGVDFAADRLRLP